MSADFGADPAYASTSGMANKIVRRTALIVGVLLAANLIVLLMARWLDPQTDGPFGSSFVTTAEGVGAWHDLLVELGRSTERLRVPFTDAPVTDETAVIVVDPGDVLDQTYASTLEAHARRGGRIVLVGVGEIGRLFDVGVDAIAVDGGGVDDPVPGEWTEGVRRLEPDSKFAYRVADDRIDVLVGGAPQARVVRWPVGEGDIVAVGDPWLFTNRQIGRADNAVLAVRLAGGGPMAFDEYVHGFGTDEGFSGLGLSILTFFVLAVVAALIGIWAVGKRLGPPEQTVRALPPSRSEYLDAMAGNVVRTQGWETYEVLRSRSMRHVHRIGERYVGLAPDAQQAKAAAQLRLSQAELAVLSAPPRDREGAERLASVAAKIERRTERTRRWTN